MNVITHETNNGEFKLPLSEDRAMVCPITVVKLPNGADVMCMWHQPSPEERQAIADGASVVLLVNAQPDAPIPPCGVMVDGMLPFTIEKPESTIIQSDKLQ